MPIIEIEGVNVKFPFQPYEVQRNYMAKVINSLNESRNAMLESPTGTGKTLCLLCSTLAWVEHKKAEGMTPPTVIYASRTHSQIAQAMKELKRSAYNDVTATVIGSRDQLCIHPDLKEMSNSEKVLECKHLRKRKKCEYYANPTMPKFEESVTDIEDLLRAGVQHECCPYYVAKARAKHVRVIFMPYNYLIDPLIREAVLKDIEMNNAIVIMDEAHNVPNVCETSASATITSTQIIIALREMKFIVEQAKDDDFKKHEIERNDAINLKSSLHRFLNAINEIPLENNGTKTHSGGYIQTLFEKGNVAESDIFLIEKLIEILFENKENKAPQGKGLAAIANFLKVAYTSGASQLKDRIDSYYNVYLENEPINAHTQNDESDDTQKWSGSRKVVNFWCFSPAFGIHNILGQDIRSLILTSGTLSPFQPIINEMAIPMPITLSNPHVIEHFQVYAEICRNGVKNEKMDGSYDNRENPKYYKSLGESIIKVAKVVPDGLLIFFKSYGMMETCERLWRRSSIWTDLQQQKPIFIEPKDKHELKPMMLAYNASVDQNKGAIFMAVLRGKVSEGLDFADMYGRGVIIVGIPYGPTEDPRIILKKECLDRNRTRENQLISGDTWYLLEAIRAVNQAIGRVIRHKNDFGAILFLDDQFSERKIQAYISSWIKSHLTNQPLYAIPFGAVIHELTTFFTQPAIEALPKPDRQNEIEPDLSDEDVPALLILPRIKAELIKEEPNTQPHLEIENVKTEPMDLDCIKTEDVGITTDPQVTLHERKRKTSANSAAKIDEDASEPQSSTSAECNGIKLEDTKRTRLDDLDINMNNFKQEAMGNLDFVGYSELSRDFRKSYGTGGDIRFGIETDEQILSKLLKIYKDGTTH